MNDHPVSETDDSRLAELSDEECLRRLATRTIGRLTVILDHYPQVFVVNYRLDDFVIVFRTNQGTKLHAANHANVSFEVDEIDEVHRSGWTVVVLGMAEDVTDHVGDVTAERSRNLGVEPWAPGEKSRLVRIIPARITGRQLSPADLGYGTDDHGYL